MVIRGREFEYGPEGQGMKKGQWVTDLLSGKRDSNSRPRPWQGSLLQGLKRLRLSRLTN